MTVDLRWRIPAPTIPVRWRGPLGMQAALRQVPAQALAAIVGPPGPAGPQGPAGAGEAPLRLDASLAATWILPHPLGRIPTVQIFLASGEAVLSDAIATASQITVIFPTPQQGFVLAF